MWITDVDRRHRWNMNVLTSTVVHFTASFSGVNATEDVDLNVTLPLAVKERVERTALGEDEVIATNLRRGGEHAIGGAWAARLLTAAGVLVMLASAAGFVGITTGVALHLWMHFFLCFFSWAFAVGAAHTLLEHSDDTKSYIANHWQVIQTGVLGDNVAAEDAAAFATQHMRAAAALGALCVVILSVSLASTAAALLVVHGWIGPGANRRGVPLFRGGALGAGGGSLDGPAGSDARGGGSHRRLTEQDDEWGNDGWGDGWDDEDDGKLSRSRVARVDARGAQARVGSDSERSPSKGRSSAHVRSKPDSGDAVLEMSDLRDMVQEARGGRGRFKNRGGKSSRTPSPDGGFSPGRASAPAAKLEAGLLSLFARVTGGVTRANFDSRGSQKDSGTPLANGGSSVFRDEISRPGHSRAEVAAAVSMLRAAAARRNPDDPDAALRAALEVAGEGDATLIREALGRGFAGSPRGRAQFTLE
jgi:hypothetical protein